MFVKSVKGFFRGLQVRGGRWVGEDCSGVFRSD